MLEGLGSGLPCSIGTLATVSLASVSGLGQDVLLHPSSGQCPEVPHVESSGRTRVAVASSPASASCPPRVHGDAP